MMMGFALRMLGSVAYSMVVQYYYGFGDSFTFYSGGNFFRDQIKNDLGSINYLFAPFDEMKDWFTAYTTNPAFTGYFSAPASNMVMRISAIFSYLSFNAFLIISLFFSFFSFMGQWKLFKVFNGINNYRYSKLLAFAILYTPSIWFWGSGILKDSICLGSVGFIIHILYKFFVRKKFSFLNLFFLCFLIFIVNTIKSYIITIITMGIIIMFFSVFIKSFKNRLIRLTLIFFAIITSALLFYVSNFTNEINELAEESIAQIEDFQKNYQTSSESDETSKAGFGLGELDPTPTSLILKSPVVIFTCLFRPFIWESRKVFILFTSFETMLVFLSTMYLMFRIGIIRFFTSIFKTPYLLFCFVISMLFALIIGFTTFNFGTMIRYKIIFLPFYYFLLVNLYINYVAGRKKIIVSVANKPAAEKNIEHGA